MKIVLGRRSEKESNEFSIFLGRKLSENHELKEDVYLDVNSPHMILIAGKREQENHIRSQLLWRA